MEKTKINCGIDLQKCPDCKVDAGYTHERGCEVERCSVCGSQYIGCKCKRHDRKFARWTGFWPGELESRALNMDLNTLYLTNMHKIIFVKPN